MSDLSGDRRRFFLSTAQYEAKINALHVNLPMPGLIRGKWVNVVFDLASLMNENFRNQVFRSLNGVTLSGTFKLRKIFSLKFRPPDTSGAEVLDYDYANRHIEAIPRAVSFPIGVENTAQIFNMNRILISASKSSHSLKSEAKKGGNMLSKLYRSDKYALYPASLDNKMNDSHKKKLSKTSTVKKPYHIINDKNQHVDSADLGKISPKNIQKLPPIVASVVENENIRDHGTTGKIENDQYDCHGSLNLESKAIMQKEKTYDPALYFSPENRQELDEREFSTADQLQNDIDEFFKTHEISYAEKEKLCDQSDESESNAPISKSDKEIPVNHLNLDYEESCATTIKPLHITGVGSFSRTSDSGVESPFKKSYNRTSSDDELQDVAASLNNLLSDLKNDSETTLFPALDEGSRDRQQLYASCNQKLKRDDSIYFSSGEESEGDLELIFDPLGNSFTDPKTGKHYKLDN